MACDLRDAYRYGLAWGGCCCFWSLEVKDKTGTAVQERSDCCHVPVRVADWNLPEGLHELTIILACLTSVGLTYYTERI